MTITDSPFGGDDGSGGGSSNETEQKDTRRSRRNRPTSDPDVGGEASGQSDTATGAPEGSGGAFDVAQDITRVSVATDGETGGGVEEGPGANNVTQQAQSFEKDVIEATPGVESVEQVRIAREGDTLKAELTDSGELGARRVARQRARERVRTGLTGLGVEGTRDTGLRGPRTGEPTKRERERAGTVEKVFQGLGIEGTRRSGFRAPRSGGETFQEQQRDTAKVGLGVEGVDTGLETAPVSGEETFREKERAEQVDTVLRGVGFDRAGDGDGGVERDFEDLDPYEKLSADVDDDAPAPIEFLRTSDGTIQFQLFGQGDPPVGTERISAGEAFTEQFATPDTEITDSLTGGTEAGFLTDEQELERLEAAQEIRDFYQPDDEVKAFTLNLTGSETAAELAGGISRGPANILAAVDEGIVLADTGVETVLNVGATADEFGTDETWNAIGESFGAAGVAIGTEVRDNPAGFAGEVIGELAVGSLAFKGIEKAGDASRAARLSTKRTVDLEDVTTEQGAKGELPKFDTDPSAPTSQAVREVSERAADNPDVVKQGTGGDSTLFHGTQSKFDKVFEVTEGASELPGLFVSPEASPIALQGLAKSADLSSLKPRLPRPSGKSDRFLGLPGDTVKAMDEAATGAGYELRDTATGSQVRGGLGRGEAKALAEGLDEVDVAPDQTTPGYEFLTEQADPGAAYVRPQGARTRELEAIFPPGSGFQKTGTVGVRVGRRTIPGTDRTIPFSGRTVPLDLFERAGDDLLDAEDAVDPLESLQAGDAATAGSLSSDIERLGTPEGSVASGGAVTGGSAGLIGSAPSDVDAAVSSMVSDVDLFDDSELDESMAESMGSRTDSPRGSDTESTDLESGITDIDVTSDLFGDSEMESIIEPVETVTVTETTPTSSPPPSTSGTPGSGSPSGPSSPPGSPTGTEVPPASSGPPTSPPGSSSTGIPGGSGTTPFGVPEGDPTPVVPPTSELPELNLDDRKKKKRKKPPLFAATEKFAHPVATPEEILFGDALDLDGVDVDLVD